MILMNCTFLVSNVQMDDDYEGFEWIQLMKYEENVLAFSPMETNQDETLMAVCNFAAVSI